MSASPSKTIRQRNPVAKRPPLKRDWRAVNVKLEQEGVRCRVCGTSTDVQRAHTIARLHDGRHIKTTRPRTLVVDPDDIVPLCGPATDSNTCHGRFDNGDLDLLPHMTLAEQLAAVSAAGGIEAARIRLAPTAYPSKAAA